MVMGDSGCTALHLRRTETYTSQMRRETCVEPGGANRSGEVWWLTVEPKELPAQSSGARTRSSRYRSGQLLSHFFIRRRTHSEPWNTAACRTPCVKRNWQQLAVIGLLGGRWPATATLLHTKTILKEQSNNSA